MKAKVCIITGTPGTGKTVLAKKLGKKINSKIISLSQLIANESHIIGYDDERETNIANFKTLIPRLRVLVKKYRKDQTLELIIIEGHFSDVVPKRLVDYIIALRCHPDELYRRLKQRDYKESKIKENVQAEILAECISYLLEKKFGIPIFEIDTSEGKFDEIANKLLGIIKNDKSSDVYQLGQIDWLEEIHEKDMIDEYFD